MLSATAQRPNDWEKRNLKGKPYRIVSTTWDLVLKFGEWTKDPESEYKQTIEFNEAGFITMEGIPYARKEDGYSVTNYQYDTENLLTAEFSAGILRNTYEYQLDDNKRVISRIKKGQNGNLNEVIKYKYDTQGRIVQEAAYNKEGDPTKITDYVRDARGWVVRERVQEWDYGGIRAQQWENTTVYRNNEYGDPVYKALYYIYAADKKPISEARKTHKYDSKGNAVSIIFDSPGRKSITEREIQYDRPDNACSEPPLTESEQVSLSDNPVTSAEKMPTFMNGDIKTFVQWCAQNVHYPQTAIDNGYQGKVMVQFIVERDGSVSSVTVLQGANQTLSQEAVRVVQSSPKWSPGMNGRVPVRMQMEVPIRFVMEIIN